MGAIIRNVHVSHPRDKIVREESVTLAANAACECFRLANCPPSDIDLFINTGIFRDEHICEPAIASLIQKKISENISLPHNDPKGTFSFDLNNGGCGFLNAIQIVDCLMRSGNVKNGMIVTSDVDTFPVFSEGVHFDPAGAAVLLNHADDDCGFTAFHFETFPLYIQLFDACLSWVKNKKPRHLQTFEHSKHALIIKEDVKYLDSCVECTYIAMRNFFKQEELAEEDIDLIIPSLYPVGFPHALSENLKLQKPYVVDASGQFGSPYTSGIAASLQAAMSGDLWKKAQKILFVSVGAGISVMLALYKKTQKS